MSIPEDIWQEGLHFLIIYIFNRATPSRSQYPLPRRLLQAAGVRCLSRQRTVQELLTMCSQLLTTGPPAHPQVGQWVLGVLLTFTQRSQVKQATNSQGATLIPFVSSHTPIYLLPTFLSPSSRSPKLDN